MRITTEVQGAEEAILALDRFGDGLPKEMEDELKLAGQPVVAALQAYPPPPTNSTYVRTFAYQQSIQSAVDVVGQTAIFAAWSDSTYEKWLRGDLEGYAGAWMHRGRWRSLQDIWDTFTQVVIVHLERRLDAILQRLGLSR